jgi:hypothetical protein
MRKIALAGIANLLAVQVAGWAPFSLDHPLATFAVRTPSVLSARLKSLEADAVIATRSYEMHPPRVEYFLTPKGRELGPILRAMKRWGEKHA